MRISRSLEVIATVLLLTLSRPSAGAEATAPDPKSEAGTAMADARRRFDAADYAGALAAVTRATGSGGVDPVDAHEMLGRIYKQIDDFRHASDEYDLAVAALRARAGSETPRLAELLTGEATARRGLADYPRAETLNAQALSVLTGAPDPVIEADVRTNMGVLSDYERRYSDAEVNLRAAVDIRRRVMGADDPRLAQALDDLGVVLWQEGRLIEAEPLLREGLAIRRRALPPNHPDLASSLGNLGALAWSRGEPATTAALAKEAAAVDAAVFGPETPEVLLDLQNLAEAYRALGRLDEARRLHTRILEVRKANDLTSGADASVDLDLAVSYGNLANVLDDLGDHAAAIEDQRAALAIDRKQAGPTPSRDVVLDVNNLAQDLVEVDPKAAEDLFREALGDLERLAVPKDPLHATIMQSLGDLALDRGDVAEAARMFREARDLRVDALPPTHVSQAVVQARLALTSAMSGSVDEARRLARQAVGVVAGRFAAITIAASASAVEAEGRSARDALEHVLWTFAVLSPGAATLGSDDADTVLAAVQMAQTSTTAATVSKLARRAALANHRDADLLRQLEASVEARGTAETIEARQAAGLPTEDLPRGLPSVASLDLRIADLLRDLGDLGRGLAGLRPVTLEQARAVLSPDEAWVGYLVGDRVLTVSLTNDGVRVTRGDLDRAAVGRMVADVTASLDEGAASAGRAFDLATAARAYQALVGPSTRPAGGKGRTILSLDGPLYDLPFGVLVREMPPSGLEGDDAYRAASWYGDDGDLSLVPDLGSLVALRRLPAAAGRGSFVGFGDPVLGPPHVDRDPAAAVSFMGDSPAAATVAQLPSVPETGAQLEALRETFGTRAWRVVTGSGATRTAVMGSDLTGFDVVAFATHGLVGSMVASKYHASEEPALVMTPSDGDNGLLTASDVSRLRLDADLVVLSACNTASTLAGHGSDGLSGLSKAFFQAGARSLLVSHWSVEVGSASALLKAFAADRSEDRSTAWRHAMTVVRGSRSADGRSYAHPYFWAPFSYVGAR